MAGDLALCGIWSAVLAGGGLERPLPRGNGQHRPRWFFGMRGGMGLMGESGAGESNFYSTGTFGAGRQLGVKGGGGGGPTVVMNTPPPMCRGSSGSQSQIAASA